MEEYRSPQVTRSQFLKILVAGGTATAVAAFLPGKWAKPLVKVGVLPVHAQSSYTVTLTGLDLNRMRGLEPGKGPGLASPRKMEELISSGYFAQPVNFDYEDSYSEVDDNAIIHYSITPVGESVDSRVGAIKDLWMGMIIAKPPDPIAHAGTVYFQINLLDSYYMNGGPTIEIIMEVNGRMSNPISDIAHPT
jgi:hypothetical protein